MAALLHQLLEESALRHPNQVAVYEKSSCTSYTELNAFTQQLASLINSLDLAPSSRIGLIVDKSLAAFQAIYGVLKSGNAYVPMDKKAPTERLSYIINDCKINALIITRSQLKRINDISKDCAGVKVLIIVDSDLTNLEHNLQKIKLIGKSEIESQDNAFELVNNPVDQDLAYILYTSGSTGKPKGVMINHHTALSFVNWACEYVKLDNNDRVSAHAPLHFDLSIFDIFATAKAGATLVPVPDGASTFPSRLLDWINDNNITVWYSVPSVLSMMAQQKNFDDVRLSNLRCLIFAGEVFPVPYLKKWLQKQKNTRFMNWFGPTETNVSTCYEVTTSADEIDRPLPIGRPTGGANILIIDENGEQITSPGKTGEIYARGPCVALGYWGDDKKTKQKFVTNPFNPWLSDRVFKSGDLVSLDVNGNLIFQGRNDHLVKCRGYRIELGEVESALYQVNEVNECAVIPKPDDMIGNRLIAFVSYRKDSFPNTEKNGMQNDLLLAIRKFISNILPSYMLPDEIKLFEQLPKNANGKIDRQKLTSLL